MKLLALSLLVIAVTAPITPAQILKKDGAGQIVTGRIATPKAPRPRSARRRSALVQPPIPERDDPKEPWADPSTYAGKQSKGRSLAIANVPLGPNDIFDLTTGVGEEPCRLPWKDPGRADVGSRPVSALERSRQGARLHLCRPRSRRSRRLEIRASRTLRRHRGWRIYLHCARNDGCKRRPSHRCLCPSP